MKKKDLFWFLAIFDKNTGHRVTKIYPVSRISITYKSYLIKIFLSRKIFFDFFYIHYFELIFQRRRDGVVGRAVVGKIKIPGSSLACCQLFFFVFSSSAFAEDKKTPHLRKAEHFFAKKSSAFFC